MLWELCLSYCPQAVLVALTEVKLPYLPGVPDDRESNRARETVHSLDESPVLNLIHYPHQKQRGDESCHFESHGC